MVRPPPAPLLKSKEAWQHNKLTLSLTAAAQTAAQMAQMNPTAGGFGPEQDPDKLFKNEAENLEVLEHRCVYDGIEERLLAKYAMA